MKPHLLFLFPIVIIFASSCRAPSKRASLQNFSPTEPISHPNIIYFIESFERKFPLLLTVSSTLYSSHHGLTIFQAPNIALSALLLLLFTRSTTAVIVFMITAIAVGHLLHIKHTAKMLSPYVESQLAHKIGEQRKLPTLDGENRQISALFSDIRGFSTFAERWQDDPKKLAYLLNMYLTRVTKALMDNSGYVDKYMGDAVVALFGAPLDDEEHAKHACEAALKMKHEIELMREEFHAQGLPDVYTRIGVNSDTMYVGNIGAKEVLDYTAIGDGMNLASRLEGANKAYNTVIIIGEGTWLRAKDHIEVRELDVVRVNGKKQPVRIFELLALKGELPPSREKVVRGYKDALARYRVKDFTGALMLLDENLLTLPTDGPSLALKKRCEDLLHKGTDEDFESIVHLPK